MPEESDKDQIIRELLEALDFGPAVFENGDVALHINKDKSAVVLFYIYPEEGYKDLQTLKQWAQKIRGLVAKHHPGDHHEP